MLGSTDVSDPTVAEVARGALATYKAKLAEMPYDGPTVSGMVAMASRHEALFAFWTDESCRLGLTTPEGVKASEQAIKHGIRAERLMVTALDIATAMCKREATPVDPLAGYLTSRPVEVDFARKQVITVEPESELPNTSAPMPAHVGKPPAE